jgi:hypothetical protein
MGVILTHSTSTAGSSGSGAFSQIEKLAIEMEMEFQTASTSYFKDLNYTNEVLTNIDIWTSQAMTLKLFSKLLQYDADENLSRAILTRISDDAGLVKILEYDGSGNLDTITVSAG